MGNVKIKKSTSTVSVMIDVIAVLLGVLTVLLFAFSGGALEHWRYNALRGIYGSFAPLALVFFVLILIVVYLKFNEN